VTIPVINANSSIVISTEWIATAGNHTFWVIVDYNEDIGDGYIAEGYAGVVVSYLPVASFDIYQNVDITITVTGRKANTVGFQIFEDGLLLTQTFITRIPGNPTGQASSITLHKNIAKEYVIIIVYNATHDGGNPTWLNFSSNGFTAEYFIAFNTQDGYFQELTVDTSYLDSVVQYNRLFSFDASNSYDPGGELTSFEWDFGDSNQDTGVQVEHTYSNAGVYTVTLTVTDVNGDTDEKTVEVIVN